MTYRIKPPVIQSNRVKVIREGIGMGSFPQRHRSSPTNRGIWVWIFNYMEHGMTFSRHAGHAPKIPTIMKDDRDLNSPVDQEQVQAYWNRLDEWEKTLNPKRYRYGWIDLDDMIYVGWNRQGKLTRSGFFNVGEWNHLPMWEALRGLNKMVASYLNPKSPYTIDMGDTQLYIPHTTKIH